MRLTPGTRLGPYEVTALIGAGGMGEVYRAHDIQLARDVAVKILPSAFTSDPDRLARFEREARVLAALNHPNIATLYGLEESDGVRGLVMELVEGSTLADRLAEGPLPAGQALAIAGQIAEALDAAHERGIAHRDLKPANIKLTRDGVVKVLDFGLAKVAAPADTADRPGTSPTVTMSGTREGAILGTAAYMSPEQARGQPIDKRTDIWAFGCVLYEMLAGGVAFAGPTVSDTIAAILERDPVWTALPASTPPGLLRLIQRCLEKDRKLRLRDIGDARAEIEDVLRGSAAALTRAGPPVASAGRTWSRRIGAWTLPLLLVAAAVTWIGTRGGERWTNPLQDAQFTRLTDFDGSELDAALSPDGKLVAFLADRDGPFDAFIGQVGLGTFANVTKGQFPELYHETIPSVGFTADGTELWLRVTATTAASRTVDDVARGIWLIPALGGTPRRFLERANSASWSPDGGRIAYSEPRPGDPIFVADRQGISPRQVFASRPGEHTHYVSWSPDGRYLYFVRGFRSTEMDVWRVAADGGAAEQLTRHKAKITYPTALSDQTLLYIGADEASAGSVLYAMDLKSGASHRANLGVENFISIAASDGPNGRWTRLVASVSDPRGTIWTVPILDRVATESDAKRMELPGVRALAPRYGSGYLLYLSSRGDGNGLWKLQGGVTTELWKPADGVLAAPAAISPDGSQVCVTVRAGTGQHLYLMTPEGTRIRAFAPSLDVRDSVSWSPDGKAVVASVDKGLGGRLWTIPVDGGAPEQLVDEVSYDPVWSPDGRFILYYFAPQAAVFPLRGVTPEKRSFRLPEVSTRGEGGRFRFMPGGKSFVVLLGPYRHQNFFLVNVETGERRQLTAFAPGPSVRDFDVSPDGRRIVFDRIQENADVVLIDLPRGGR